jgi:hypothetical protein
VTFFVVCGKANFTNLSRYSDYSERTYRRQYQNSFDFIDFHAQTILMAIPLNREQVAAMDCSFIDKSGKQTWGLDNFYNSSISKSQKGLEISVIAVVDVSAHQGYTLSVQQTATTIKPIVEPHSPKPKKPRKRKSPSELIISERVKGYIEQLKTTRPHFPCAVKYIAADSFYSKKSIVDSVVQLELHLVSKLRIDANLRYCYTGEQKPKGSPRKYDGKVDLTDLSRLELVCELAKDVQLYSAIVWHISLKRQIRIVYLIDISNPKKYRVALLFSTDIMMDPETLYRYYRSRFQVEFIFRDAKQFTGLCDCQSRQQSSLNFHFNTSLAALNIAKLEQQQFQSSLGDEPVSLSMATYKRQALNRHLLEKFIFMLGLDPTLIKSHPNYESLLQYGSLTP